MTKYEIIVESLQSRIDCGELTLEEAEVLNELAYNKYSEDYTEYEEATRLAKEIHKSERKRYGDHDSIGYGKMIATLSNKDMDDLFDGDERGFEFKRKCDDKYKQELIDNDPKHDLKHAIGSMAGHRIKTNQKARYNISPLCRTNIEKKERVKDKYKNFDGRDFTNKKGPYWYGDDLKTGDMKPIIKKNIKDIKNRKENKL